MSPPEQGARKERARRWLPVRVLLVHATMVSGNVDQRVTAVASKLWVVTL